MSDPGTRAADAAHKALERRFRGVYRQAQKEIIEKLDAFTKQMNAQIKIKLAQVKSGQITQEEFNKWQANQLFRQKQWKDKVDSVATTLLTANQQANDMIEGKRRAVFGENATFQAYSLEHEAGLDLSFSVYDSATVTRLLRDQPELLPRKVVNGKKDMAWNRRNIANAVTQGIIQGESIDDIAKRIAKQTSSTNMSAMTRYARTAMTGAQNAGRIEVMHEAQDMGIKVKKEWIATLDSRTRDAHAELDGQVVEVDKPFKSELGDIMYPGDPSAAPGNIWNCRCTLGYVYDEYPEQYTKRRAYVEYIDDNGEYHRESHEIADMSYEEWKRIKGRDNQLALEAWRENKKVKPPEGAYDTLAKIDRRIKRLEENLEYWDMSIHKNFPKDAMKATKWEDELKELYKQRAQMKYQDDDVMGNIRHIEGKHTAKQDIEITNAKLRSVGSEGYEKNCQRCVPTYEMRRRGYDVIAKPAITNGQNDNVINNWRNIFEDSKWIKCKNGSGVREIERNMKSWGNGARAEVFVEWLTGDTHVFVAENVRGTIVYREPQLGYSIRPPFTTLVTEGKTEICRIDNLKPSKLILDCCEEAKK